MKKTTQLRNMINSKQLEFLMEAHSALSGKIAEEAGFKGIWGSGLSISAALGVRDNNEASWTQVMEVLEFMSDATTIPILLDGDTGYGNFNNARRLVKKLEQRSIAGVCIEDKLFPKTNSFIKGEAQPLADIEEFCYKIKAMKDTQKDDDFVVVSRVEAFIAGWGLREALKRAEAYRKAGADAILIHSKKSNFTEIEAFMKEWGERHPIVIVPTKYYTVPTEKFREAGISMAIWANQNLRASITAMQKASMQIYQDESLINVENKVAPIEKVFQLQGATELADAEKKYLPGNQKKANSIILVKEHGNQVFLDQQIDQFNKAGIKNIYLETASDSTDVCTLYKMKEKLNENTIISFNEIIYQNYLLEDLLNDSNDITLMVDADYDNKPNKLYIEAKTPYSKKLYSKTVDLVNVLNAEDTGTVHGEFIGLWKVSDKGVVILREALEQLATREDFQELSLIDLYKHILRSHSISVKYINGQWLDMESYKEIQQAGDNIDKH